MTFRNFRPGDILTADDADLLMRQGLIIVANADERDAIPAPSEGMRVYRLDTKATDVYTSNQWISGSWQVIPTGGFMNGFTAGPTPPAYRYLNGFICLSGQLYRSQAPSEQQAFALPAWAAPRGTLYLPTILDWACVITVQTAGEVRVKANILRTGGPGYPLDGLSWPAVAQ